jgi:ACT domain-containing protein
MTDKSGAIVIQRIALEDLQQTVERLQRENERLIQQHDNDMHTIEVGSHANAELHVENERLRAHIEKGHKLVNDMDLRMPEQATEDADGWINSYRIPVGPWHRLLGWARGGW